MIWELMKRDPAWQVMPAIALVMIIMAMLSAPTGAPVLSPVLLLLLIGVPVFRQRSTPLQATLPIPGKQLFLSRVASLMACTWLPTLAAAAVTVALRSDPASTDHLPLLEAGAVVTVALLLVQCIRVQTIDAPRWLAVVPYACIFLVLLLITGYFPRPAAAAIEVLGGCAVVSAALFLKAWTNVPGSFQLAPAEPVSAGSDKGRRTWPTVAWWPVFRSLYGWQAGLLLFAVFTMMLMGGGLFALWVVPLLFTHRLGLRWLLHLPISARKLFWAMWLPMTAAMVAGVVLEGPFEKGVLKRPDVSPKTHMVAIAVILLSWLIQICGFQLGRSKSLWDTPFALKFILSGAPSLVACAICLAPIFLRMAGVSPSDHNSLFDAVVSNVASVLPDNLWMIALIAAPPIAGLYWLAEKLFREMEFGQIEIMAYGASEHAETAA